jgi:hypothetical protein
MDTRDSFRLRKELSEKLGNLRGKRCQESPESDVRPPPDFPVGDSLTDTSTVNQGEKQVVVQFDLLLCPRRSASTSECEIEPLPKHIRPFPA